MASNNLCVPSPIGRWIEIEDAHEEVEVNNLARDLMETGMDVKQWLPIRELVAAHRDLQPYLQSTDDPLMNAMNDHMTTALNIIDTSVANLNDIQNTGKRLQSFDTPKEVVAIVNESGRRVCERIVDTICQCVDSLRRDREVLETSFETNKRQKEQRKKIKKILGGIVIASLVVTAVAGLVATANEVAATMSASRMTVTQTSVIAVSTIRGSVVISSLKGKQH